MIKFEILIDHDEEVHVLGNVDDEFGVRWGPLGGQAEQEVLGEARRILGYGSKMAEPHARRFVLLRDEDVTGISGTGIVAEGVIFRDGVGCLRWLTEWPSSVVHYDRGAESIEAVHGHGGKTRIVWLDA